MGAAAYELLSPPATWAEARPHGLPTVLSVETAAHAEAIEALTDAGFGPERFKKTVYKLREGIAPTVDLCLIAEEGSRLVGSIRYWPVAIGAAATPALMLGPIVVVKDRQGAGVGGLLMRESLARAAELGHRAVILVGDEPYYRRFGFKRDLAAPLSLPGPVDEARFLALELVAGAMAGLTGMVGRAG